VDGLKSPGPSEVISSILNRLKRGDPAKALSIYEQSFRPHIYHQLESGTIGGTSVVGIEQWKLPTDGIRQLLHAAKQTARYNLAEEFFTMLTQAEAVIGQDVSVMLGIYATTSEVKKAEALFDQTQYCSPESPNYIPLNVYIYNGILKVYQIAEQPTKAREIWDRMIFEKSRIKLNAASYSAALSAKIIRNEELSPMLDLFIASAQECDQYDAWKRSRLVAGSRGMNSEQSPYSASSTASIDTFKAGHEPKEPPQRLLSAISFSSFISAVPPTMLKTLEPRLTQARKMIPSLQGQNYTMILSAYAHAGMRKQTEEIEEEMFSQRMAASPMIVTTLLALYTRLNLVEHQRRFIMKVQAQKPDLHSMTAVVSSLCQQGLSGAAMVFFREFQKNNVFLDIAAYNSAMRAAAVSANPKLVLDLMQEAKDRGLELDQASYAMLQFAYSRNHDVEGFRSSMVKLKEDLGVNPDGLAWTAYLQLLRKSRARPEEIEAGIHSMLACGFTPQSRTLVSILSYLESKGAVAVLNRIEGLAKSGALGSEAIKLVSQHKPEMPIGPLLKQAMAHYKLGTTAKQGSDQEGPL
jgi:hypothetical protein